MKYYKNDIVEIVTGDYANASDIPSYLNQQSSVTFVGQRYRVDSYGKDVLGYVFGCGYAEPPEKLRLYKRPLINWIKWILSFVATSR